jgi:hypothetical protein
MRFHPVVSTAVAVVVLSSRAFSSPVAVLQTASSSPPRGIVTFFADDFWLNLHHFLYVLGRAEARAPDSQREAVAGAPADQDQGLATLPGDEQRSWRETVTAYAGGLSKLDAVSDDGLVTLASALAGLGNSGNLQGASPAVPADEAAALNRVAPIYRKTWWPAHRRANQQWIAAMQPLIERHGAAILAFITHVYQLPWPARGYPVHVSGYTMWAGAYSTAGPLLVISSLGPGTSGESGLETVFHESMHQWDDPVYDRLAEIGKVLGKSVPDGLTHAMIWLTAGEAVRRVIPDHVPYAEAHSIWQRVPNVTLRPAIEAAWRPYLNGAGTRDEALTALMKLAGR